jgi:hypothetical protein
MPIPSCTAEADPIYAAIERHKKAYAAHGATLADGCDDATATAASHADIDARNVLLEIRPTTVAGAAALTGYAWEFEQQPGEGSLWYADEGISDLCRHLTLSLEAILRPADVGPHANEALGAPQPAK